MIKEQDIDEIKKEIYLRYFRLEAFVQWVNHISHSLRSYRRNISMLQSGARKQKIWLHVNDNVKAHKTYNHFIMLDGPFCIIMAWNKIYRGKQNIKSFKMWLNTLKA
jgi:hypothetical protein